MVSHSTQAEARLPVALSTLQPAVASQYPSPITRLETRVTFCSHRSYLGAAPTLSSVWALWAPEYPAADLLIPSESSFVLPDGGSEMSPMIAQESAQSHPCPSSPLTWNNLSLGPQFPLWLQEAAEFPSISLKRQSESSKHCKTGLNTQASFRRRIGRRRCRLEGSSDQCERRGDGR